MYMASSGVFKPLENTSYGISDFDVHLKAASLECSFVRNTVTEIPSSIDGTTQKFDLNSSPYFLVVSSGSLNGNGDSLQYFAIGSFHILLSIKII